MQSPLVLVVLLGLEHRPQMPEHLALALCLAALPRRVAVVVQEHTQQRSLVGRGAAAQRLVFLPQFQGPLVTLQAFRHLKGIMVEAHHLPLRIMGRVEEVEQAQLVVMGHLRMAALAVLEQHLLLAAHL